MEIIDPIVEEAVEDTSRIITLYNKEKILLEQLELLQIIIKRVNFKKKLHFLSFTQDKYLFDVISNPYELLEAFRLRFLAYSHPDVDYINPELFPLNLEFDKYDQVSTHFIARNLKDNNKLCGYLRMIHDTSLGLQVEKGLDISDYRTKYKICEGSRLITYPRGQPLVRKALFNNIKIFAREMGIEKILGETSINMKDFYTSMGLVPMEPFRTWNFSKRKEWGSSKDLAIYGNIIHLDQEGHR